MRISVCIITGLIALLSCNPLKNNHLAKQRTVEEFKENFNQTELSLLNYANWQNARFRNSDSTETFSMVEIVPAGSVKVNEGKGLELEAQSLRIFTKRRTGSIQSGESQALAQTDAIHQTDIHIQEETSQAEITKEKTNKVSPWSILLAILLIGITTFAIIKLLRRPHFTLIT